jgi:large subunit ribosomal protein L28
MAKTCQVTGKRPLHAHKVSHSNRKSNRRLLPNLQNRRFWVPSLGRWVRLRVTAAGIRDIDKRGIETVVASLRARGVKV